MSENLLSRLILTASATSDDATADLLREAARTILSLNRELHTETEDHALTTAALNQALGQ